MVRCDKDFRSWFLSVALLLFLAFLIPKLTYADAQLTATVSKSSQDIHLCLSNFHSHLTRNIPITSNQFTFMGKHAQVKLFAGGTNECKSHVRVELHVDGKFYGGMDSAITNVIFEHVRFDPEKSYKPACALGCDAHGIIEKSSSDSTSSESSPSQPNSSSEESGDSPGFVIACNQLMKVEDLLTVPDNAFFTIYPLSRGDLDIVKDNNHLRMVWKVLKQDMARMKRGLATLQSHTYQSLGAYMELRNTHTIAATWGPRISYLFRANSQDFPFTYGEFYYFRGAGSPCRLGSHGWNPVNQPFQGQESADPDTYFKTIQTSGGDEMWVMFQMDLQRESVLGTELPNTKIECPHRALMAANQPQLEVVSSPNGAFHYANLFNYKSLGPHQPVSREFQLEEKNCELTIWPKGSTISPNMLSLQIKPKEDLNLRQPDSQPSSSIAVLPPSDSDTTTATPTAQISDLHGFVIYYKQPSARKDPKHWCCQFAKAQAWCTDSALLDTQIIKTERVEEAAKTTNMGCFIIQPVRRLQISDRTEGIANQPVFMKAAAPDPNRPIYTVKVARHELAMTRSGMITLAGTSSDDNKYTICFSADHACLYLEIQNIHEDHFRELTAETYIIAAGSAVHWEQLKTSKRGEVKNEHNKRYVRLKLGDISRLMKKASGTADITFKIVVNKTQPTLNS